MRRDGGSRMFIWVIAVLTAGLLSATLFAMNRSLQNAISPLFEAGRVLPTATPPSPPAPAISPTPIMLGTSPSVPAAIPLVGVVFAAPGAGSDGSLAPSSATNSAPAPASRVSPAPSAPRAPGHTSGPRVLAAPKLSIKPAPVQPVVAALAVATPEPVASVALATSLHSPTLTASSPDRVTVGPVPSSAVPAIILQVPRQAHVLPTTTPNPAPTEPKHHHADAAKNSSGEANGQGNDD